MKSDETPGIDRLRALLTGRRFFTGEGPRDRNNPSVAGVAVRCLHTGTGASFFLLSPCGKNFRQGYNTHARQDVVPHTYRRK
jgi:hypothetical protein